ncbi:ribose-phosphate pyrophosphokinase [Candidatus Woesearchaeota archaeon]|nr:ribose-phosphate pyrophosphokinase [Candidatus Woesearchaeota archaeon]
MVKKLSVFATSSARTLGERVVAEINKLFEEDDIDHAIHIGKVKETIFADDEVKAEILQSVRGRDVYIIASPPDPISRKIHLSIDGLLPPGDQFYRNEVLGFLGKLREIHRTTNDNFRMLLAYITALDRAEAARVTAIPTIYPNARQERSRGREPNMASLTAQELEVAGAYRVVTFDVHAEAIEGFFRTTHFNNLRAGRYLLDGFREEYMKSHQDYGELSVVSPDAGGTERARYFAKQLQCPLVVSDKRRDHSRAHNVEEIILIGEVNGRDILIPDDMVDTASTVEKVARAIRAKGGRDIYLLCTHALLNDPATGRLQKLYQEGIIRLLLASDTIYHGEAYLQQNPWLKEVSVAPLIARAIYNLNDDRSVSKLL